MNPMRRPPLANMRTKLLRNTNDRSSKIVLTVDAYMELLGLVAMGTFPKGVDRAETFERM